MTMFFKILKSDIRNGIVSAWKNYLITFFLFLLFAFFFFLERDVTIRMHPELQNTKINLGDYFFYLFVGCESYSVSGIDFFEDGIAFELPTVWFFIILWMLFILLKYPYDELYGYGKNRLVLSKRRDYWWFSKCLWTVISVFVFYATAFLPVFFLSTCTGSNISFNVSDYIPFDYISDWSLVRQPPYSVLPTLFSVFIVSMALAFIQLYLSLRVGCKYSYGIMAVFVLAGSYFDNIFLLPNYSMAARSEVFIFDGLPTLAGITLSLICILLCILLGYFQFEKVDILSNND